MRRVGKHTSLPIGIILGVCLVVEYAVALYAISIPGISWSQSGRSCRPSTSFGRSAANIVLLKHLQKEFPAGWNGEVKVFLMLKSMHSSLNRSDAKLGPLSERNTWQQSNRVNRLSYRTRAQVSAVWSGKAYASTHREKSSTATSRTVFPSLVTTNGPQTSTDTWSITFPTSKLKSLEGTDRVCLACWQAVQVEVTLLTSAVIPYQV